MKVQLVAVAVFSLFINALPIHAHTVSNKSVVIQTEAAAYKKINLNTAELSSLIGSFKGIGKKRAEAIIAYRESHRGFKSIEELAEVKGLGQRFVTVNRDKLNELFAVK